MTNEIIIEIMLAYTYIEQGKFALIEKPKPILMEPTDAIVRVTLSSICTSDLHIKHGSVPRAVPGITVGHEMVGIVEEIGSEVKNVKPGDRVTVNVETYCGECYYCKNGYVNNCTSPEGGWGNQDGHLQQSMKQLKEHKLRMAPDKYYVWCGGSCDYGHEERCSGGAYIMQKNDVVIETYVISDDHTTEFRMILSVMIHAMEVIPEGSDIVFMTNVSYIQQNFDKKPTDKSANADLINDCITIKGKHNSVSVKIVPFHKYSQLIETHEMAHETMMGHRLKGLFDDKLWGITIQT